MASFEFVREHSPYKNREALLDDYTPDTLVGRDSELEEYHGALQPAIYGEQPDNIFLYGKAGVGKTAATRFLLDKLENNADDYDDLDIFTELVNCDGLNSSYRVASHLVNILRDPANRISETGYSRSQVYELMWDELDSHGGIILLVLDEIDHLKDDSILYQLSRARENENLTEARIGLIGISNDLTFRDGLSPKVRSSLCERSISFSTYDANELRAVLEQRREVAFKDDVLTDDVIPLCAAFGAQESGDARKALDLLLKAGDLAREENAEKVSEEHVRRGRDLLEREQVARGIADLNDHERLVVYALATLEAEGETPARSREIYSRYKALSEAARREALTARWLREHLDDLAMLGILSVSEINEGSAGGKYREYALQQDLAVVLDALEETLEAMGVHTSVKGYV
ncbi:Cdc6/Cdc18 family protein [Haladaptatus salinisoli]|uniref:Cdc6/Cdc18 family protein n=1 Tax=Haladaptatus salinisoli TaxID=2884876 RepID=UPI001D0BBAD8|nr:orc1/cdc6 family replication initiation protein [Haladaptatus salinisoli]